MFPQVPYACPICGRLTLRSLLGKVEITAKMDHEIRAVGGLSAFMCTENGHIFFVMQKDVESASSSGRAAAS